MRKETQNNDFGRRSYKAPALTRRVLLEEERCICTSGELPDIPEEDAGIDSWNIEL